MAHSVLIIEMIFLAAVSKAIEHNTEFKNEPMEQMRQKQKEIAKRATHTRSETKNDPDFIRLLSPHEQNRRKKDAKHAQGKFRLHSETKFCILQAHNSCMLKNISNFCFCGKNNMEESFKYF